MGTAHWGTRGAAASATGGPSGCSWVTMRRPVGSRRAVLSWRSMGRAMRGCMWTLGRRHRMVLPWTSRWTSRWTIWSMWGTLAMMRWRRSLKTINAKILSYRCIYNPIWRTCFLLLQDNGTFLLFFFLLVLFSCYLLIILFTFYLSLCFNLVFTFKPVFTE